MSKLQRLAKEYRDLKPPKKESATGLKRLWKLGKLKHKEYYDKHFNSKYKLKESPLVGTFLFNYFINGLEDVTHWCELPKEPKVLSHFK